MQPEMSMGQGVSKEFLRAVCEPFFDQMLVAVQQALQAQSQQSCQMPAPCWQQPAFTMRSQGSDEPSTEDRSDIASEGAFSALLSGGSTPPSGCVTEEESVRSSHPNIRSRADVQAKTRDDCEDLEVQGSEEADAQNEELVSEPPQGSDQDKSAMVCRHWKSKGWCRMEDNCKFLHPDHKRGVGFAIAKPGGINGDCSADVNSSIGLAITNAPFNIEQDTAMDVKKKKSAKRKNKSKSGVVKEDMPPAHQLMDFHYSADSQGGSYMQHALMLGSTS